MQVFAGHASPVVCGEFTPDGTWLCPQFHNVLIPAILGKRILTADADGALIFWDPRSPTPLWKLTPEDGRFDLDGITSLSVNPASAVAVIGGASGGIRVVNLSKGDVVGALAAHKEGESVEAIAFVGFAGTAEVVVTGSTDGRACVWDLNTLKVRNTLEHEVNPVSPREFVDSYRRVNRNLSRVWSRSQHPSRTWWSQDRQTTLFEHGTLALVR